MMALICFLFSSNLKSSDYEMTKKDLYISQTQNIHLLKYNGCSNYLDSKQNNSYLHNIGNGDCYYNPSTDSYQICYHVTAGGQCVHWGPPC